MLDKNDVKKTVFWIAGGARSGLAAAKLLKTTGARVFVSELSALSATTKFELDELGILFEENGHNNQKFLEEAHVLVTSPAIPADKGLFKLATDHGILVVSEIEVAHWFRPKHQKWIGITGTNGKSTTTHYLQQLISLEHSNAVSCGNIGTPVCDVVATADILIIELSSYQLETTHTALFDATICLNLQEDHLLRYQNLDCYFRAKWRLVGMTKPRGICVMPANLAESAIKAGLVFPGVELKLLYERNALLEADDKNSNYENHLQEKRSALSTKTVNASLPVAIYGNMHESLKNYLPSHQKLLVLHSIESGTKLKKISQNDEFLDKDSTLFAISSPVLPGAHNATNLSASSIVAYETRLSSLTRIEAQWCKSTSRYKHLPHRLEVCFSTQDGPRIFNDSKATNLESVKVALRSFAGNVLLLLGGEPKGEDFANIASYFQSPIKKCYAFGKAAPQIRTQLDGLIDTHKIAFFKTMLDAAQQAFQESSPEDLILLSPGCASFDEFKNFEHRGDTFRTWADSKGKSEV